MFLFSREAASGGYTFAMSFCCTSRNSGCAVAKTWAKVVGAGACVAVVLTVALWRNQSTANVFAEAPAAAGPDGAKFLVEPYLQYVTRTGITIMWETDDACTAVVEYGTTFPPKLQAKVEKADTMGEVPLTGLEPNTKYFYRVVCKDAEGRELASKLMTFMTAPGPFDAFSFTVVGDTQRNPVVTGKVAKLMWERRPNFVVHCGDVVDDGASKAQWTGDLFKPCAELFGRVPVFPCIGNHEKDHPFYYRYFALPKPEHYYSYTYGNAEFFVLDTNTKRNLKADGEQYKWLDRALAASTAKWKVCYHHHPAYCSDDDDYGNTWKGSSTYGDVRVRSFVELYEKYKVDVVFNGHVHVYERHLADPRREGGAEGRGGVRDQRGRRREARRLRPDAGVLQAGVPVRLPLLLRDRSQRHVQPEGVRPRGAAVRPVRTEERVMSPPFHVEHGRMLEFSGRVCRP